MVGQAAARLPWARFVLCLEFRERPAGPDKLRGLSRNTRKKASAVGILPHAQPWTGERQGASHVRRRPFVGELAVPRSTRFRGCGRNGRSDRGARGLEKVVSELARLAVSAQIPGSISALAMDRTGAACPP